MTMGMNLNQVYSANNTVLQTQRTLTGALERLREIIGRLNRANDRARQFLDALVGPSPSPTTAGAGEAISTPCFVSDLHKLIDGIEAEARRANDASFELADAGGLCVEKDDPATPNQRMDSELAAHYRPEGQRATLGHAASLG